MPTLTNLHSETLVDIYRMLRLIRRSEERTMSEYHPADEMRCPIHFCIGQEALPAALSVLLRKDDTVFSHHRSHGYYLAKRAPVEAMIAEFYGKVTGANGGIAGSQELSHEGARFYSGTILTGAFALTAGAAFASKYRRDDSIAVGVVGDGGIEEGIAFETLNLASSMSLPALFICENNLYSAHTRIDRRSVSPSLVERARAFGVKALCCDGNDAIGMHGLLSAEIASIRRGAGPVFVEAMTYRTCGHVGPEDDDHLGYRTREELEAWKLRDPLARMRGELLSGGVASNVLDAADATVESELDQAFAKSKGAPFPLHDTSARANLSDRYSPLVTRLIEGVVSADFNPAQQETKLAPY